MVTDSEHQPTPPAAPRRLRTIALVGIDGSGKTTQAHRLAAELTARRLRATYRRNAGGRRWFGRLANALGRRDAEHLLGRRTVLLIESVLRWLAIARTLLRQALTGEVAVMDRYAVCQYASLRSHGAGSRPQAAPGRAERLARFAYRLFPDPDVTFLLAVDPSVAYDRIESRGYDHETMDFLHAAAEAYRGLPEYAEFVIIDANATPDEVAAAIHAGLAGWLPTAPPTPAPPTPAAPTPAAPTPAAGPGPAARLASASRPAPPARPASASRPASQVHPVARARLAVRARAGATAHPATVAPAPPGACKQG